MHYHQIHHPTYKNSKVMLEKVIINPENIIPCFPQKFSFIPKENKNVVKKAKVEEKFKIGEKYSLSGVECDDFEMPKKEYELVGLVSKVNDVILDSVIMKQVSGTNDTIFSLTKHDCRNLNIEFQNGLQLFPKNLNWVKLKKEIEEVKKIEEKPISSDYQFDPNNLSTYPVCHIDKTVRHIMIEISGCTYVPCGDFIITPEGNRVRKTEFISRLKIITKRPLFGIRNESADFKLNEYIPYRFMTTEVGSCTTNDIIDKNGNVYIELFLGKKQDTRYGNINEDYYVGVERNIFDNQHFNDIFEIYYLFEKPKKIEPQSQPKKFKKDMMWDSIDKDFLVNTHMVNVTDRLYNINSTLERLLLDKRGIQSFIDIDSKLPF